MGTAADLRSTLGSAPIQRAVVAVHGEEATDFLQGQLSQDIVTLRVGQTVPSLLLQPTGKVDAWLRVTRRDEQHYLLDVDAEFGDAVLARLKRFKLRTKAELALDQLSGLAIRGPGAEAVERPRGATAVPAGWPGVEGVDLLSSDELALAGVPLVDDGALEALRIECGVPAMGAELTEATIPAEAGQWLIDASVSFTKGCYTGQELVARIDSRGGNVPRPVRGIVVDGPPPAVGTAVQAEGAEVGRVTSSATSAALGAVALAAISRKVEIGTRVMVDAAPGTVVDLPMR